MTSWREVWLLHVVGKQRAMDALPPANDDPVRRYIKFPGWVPGGHLMTDAREAVVHGPFAHRVEMAHMTPRTTTRFADKPSSLSLFKRHQDATWKSQTVSLRH